MSRFAPPPRVRLLIIDDSLVARTALSRMVESAPGMELVAVANSAEAALDLLAREAVDVILLDLDMPRMSGLEAMPAIIARGRGARILVLSALTLDGAEHTLAALSLGASDTLAKPQGRGFHGPYRDLLLGKIRDLGQAAGGPRRPAPGAPAPSAPRRLAARPGVLALGASTGGVHALAQFFAGLPRPLGIPIVVTQHLPASFMSHFARQLSAASGCAAQVAEDGAVLAPDRIVIAPGDAHLAFRKQGGRLFVRLDRSPAASGCLPSVDPMFASLAEEIGPGALGVVLSGMGRDGARGAERIVQAGGTVIAQDEATSVVWGMPRAVAEAGLAAALLPPAGLAELVGASLGLAACR